MTAMPKKKSAKPVGEPKPSLPKKVNRPTCFVISPFGGWFDKYYTDVIALAIEEAGLKAHRADDLYRPSSIIHDIWQFVRKAKILVADLTGKNPNVLYELGLAHAIGKPVIMITQSLDDIPFDLRNLRIIPYDLRDPSWGQELKRQVQSAIAEVLDAPALAVPPVFLKERKETPVPAVTPLEKMVLSLRQEVDSLRRSQHPPLRRAATIGSPSEARSALEQYLARGYSQRWIIANMSRRGVPESWTRSELGALVRAKRT